MLSEIEKSKLKKYLNNLSNNLKNTNVKKISNVLNKNEFYNYKNIMEEKYYKDKYKKEFQNIINNLKNLKDKNLINALKNSRFSNYKYNKLSLNIYHKSYIESMKSQENEIISILNKNEAFKNIMCIEYNINFEKEKNTYKETIKNINHNNKQILKKDNKNKIKNLNILKDNCNSTSIKNKIDKIINNNKN